MGTAACWKTKKKAHYMREKRTGKHICLFDRNALMEKRSSVPQSVKAGHDKNYQSKC